MTPTSWMNAAAAVYIVLSLGVLWALFGALAWVVKRVMHALGSEGKLLGGDIKIRLLALAVTAMVFTPLLNRIFRALLNLGILLVERVPRQLLVHWRTQSDLCSAEGSARCLGDTLLVPLKATGAGIAAAFRESGLLSIGLGYVIFMLALWALATHTLNALTTRHAGEERFDVHEVLLDDRFKVTRQNFLFFLILFVGAYLSLASIAAIPDLREEEGAVPTGFSGATLAENLGKVEWAVDEQRDRLADPLALTDSVFYPGLSAIPRAAAPSPASKTVARDTSVLRPRTRTDSAAAATQGAGGTTAPQTTTTTTPGTTAGAGSTAPVSGSPATATAAAAPAGTTGTAAAPADSVRRDTTAVPRRVSPAIPQVQVLALRTEAAALRRLWNDQTVRHDSVVRSLSRRRNIARQLAESAYVVSDTTRRLREQRTYYHRLQRWYLEAQMGLQGEYDESWIILRRLHRQAEGWSTSVSGYLTGPAADSLQFEQLRRDAVRLRAEDWLLAENPLGTLHRLPERGAGLGPFQYVSGWLLKTDSMPLTLIVGMVGFGLLGAAASTFVREQSRRERREARRARRLEAALRKRGVRDPHLADEMRAPGDRGQPLHTMQPLVMNLPSVVIRGGSAAIVVFLGLMGGLSVLTQEADPNPYALLFTCLAGAVFSEKVWSWAEKRFGLNLESDEDRDDEDAGGGGGGDGDGGDGGNGGDGNGDGDDGNGGDVDNDPADEDNGADDVDGEPADEGGGPGNGDDGEGDVDADANGEDAPDPDADAADEAEDERTGPGGVEGAVG